MNFSAKPFWPANLGATCRHGQKSKSDNGRSRRLFFGLSDGARNVAFIRQGDYGYGNLDEGQSEIERRVGASRQAATSAIRDALGGTGSGAGTTTRNPADAGTARGAQVAFPEVRGSGGQLDVDPDGDAKALGWTAERIDGLIREYSVSWNDETSAYAALMSPQEFLDLTLSAQGQAMLRSMDPARTKARPLDLENLAAGGSMFLEIDEPRDPDEYQVKHYGLTSVPTVTFGHEGRHRMVALQVAGFEQVPVVIIVRDGRVGGRGKRAERSGVELIRQASRIDQVNTGVKNAVLGRMVPINAANRQALVDMVPGADSYFQNAAAAALPPESAATLAQAEALADAATWMRDSKVFVPQLELTAAKWLDVMQNTLPKNLWAAIEASVFGLAKGGTSTVTLSGSRAQALLDAAAFKAGGATPGKNSQSDYVVADEDAADIPDAGAQADASTGSGVGDVPRGQRDGATASEGVGDPASPASEPRQDGLSDGVGSVAGLVAGEPGTAQAPAATQVSIAEDDAVAVVKQTGTRIVRWSDTEFHRFARLDAAVKSIRASIRYRRSCSALTPRSMTKYQSLRRN